MKEQIRGYVASGFGPVADAFALNFTDRGDTGAACCVIVEGETVVDLYAGYQRKGVRWTPETRGPVFSVSKAVTALSLLIAVEQGLLDLDLPIAAYWPEFGVHGKDRVTVRQALAHRAGVPAPSRTLSEGDLRAWAPVVDDLAAQHPLWEPNTAFTYHAVTVGFIAGEVLRRVTGMRPSQWLAENLAIPLNVNVTYGADPHAQDVARVLSPSTDGGGVPIQTADLALLERIMLMDGAYAPDIFTASSTAAFLVPESPAANVIASARDLAKLFSAVVAPAEGRARLVRPATLAAATRPLSFGKPFIGPDRGDVWATGFMVHSGRRGMVGPGSFGHDGAGGQLVFAEPGQRVAFAYQTAQARGDDDVRAEALSAALRESLQR